MAALIGLAFEEVAAIAAEAAGGRCARPPTTMAAGKSWYRATRPRSNARSRSRKAEGRQAGDGTAGVGAVPLRPDAAGCRRDGAGTRRRRRRAAGRAAGRQSRPAQPLTKLIRPTIVRCLVEQVTGTVCAWRERPSPPWVQSLPREDLL